LEKSDLELVAVPDLCRMVVFDMVGALSQLWKQLHAPMEEKHIFSWKGVREVRCANRFRKRAERILTCSAFDFTSESLLSSAHFGALNRAVPGVMTAGCETA
jgi:hypothetical protein